MDVNINLDPFFKISCEVLCIAGLDGVFKVINPAFEKMIGYTNEEVTGRNFSEFIHPEDMEFTIKKFEKFKIDKGVTTVLLNRFQDKSGNYHLLAWNSMYITNGLIYASARDVTDIKESKELLKSITKKLNHQYGLLDTVLNSVPEMVILLNEDFKFIFINDKAKENMGLGNNNYTGKTLEDLGFSYPDLEKYRSEIKDVFRTGQSISNYFSIPLQGKQTDMEYFIIPIKERDTVLGVIYTTRDVTEKNRDKKNFEASEKKLKKIIDLVPYPIFLKDSNCKYTLINTAQADLFHTTYDYLIGKSDEEFFVMPDELVEVASSDKRILEDQVNVILPEQIITDKQGNKKVLHTTKIPFLNEIENKVNILGISIDITAVKKAEAELLKTNFELDSFVYKSSHDLRAPLRSLMGLINLAKKEHDPEMRNHILDRSNKSIVKLDTFILELTNFSRNSRVELVINKINFDNIIRECVENLKFMENAQHVQIITDIHEHTEFFSDPGRIAILFMNLISNAIKYQNLDRNDPFVKIKVNIDPSQAEIVISDNGIGIEKEFHKKIFDMFFRASESSFGSGLGLYIVKQVVDKLNGTISLDSEPEQGAIFTIHLPHLGQKQPTYNTGL